MANKTVYPFGTEGQLPSNIGIINDLTTGGADKALSAEMGVALREEIVSVIPESIRKAIYAILQNVAFVNDDGYASQIERIRFWAENLIPDSISATFTQGSEEIYDTDTLDKLKRYLVVTATYGSSSIVLEDTDYVLSGALEIGTSTIMVTYKGKTDTFTVEVSASPYLYVLPSVFISNGNNSIDTLVKPEKGKTYTILVEFTQTNDSTARFVWGNRVSSSDSTYVALSVQSGKMWGFGLSWSTRVTINTNVVRSVVVATINENGAFSNITHKFKVGSGAIQTETASTYGGDSTVASDPNLTIGATYANCGVIGTVNSFAIYDGEMSATEITDFLNNGM